DTRIADLGRRLSGRLSRNEPVSAGQRLGAGLDETRAALLKLEQEGSRDISGSLREERRKLALIDEGYQAEFARVESTLRGAGLPSQALSEKLSAWRDFTGHYRQRMDATLAG